MTKQDLLPEALASISDPSRGAVYLGFKLVATVPYIYQIAPYNLYE